MKAQTVLWYAEFKSIVRVQREFRRVFNHDAPTAKSIKKWHDTLLATGSVLKKHGGGRRTSDEMVRGTTYLDMLEQFFFPQIEQLQPNILFQQDGAPSHWFNEVRATLDNIFRGRWIGRGGPIAWPPRSPDLTPLDFFLWGYVKDKVYATPVRDLRDLRERIIEAIESISEDMLQRTWQEIVHRLDIVTVTAGAHIEMW